MKHSFLKAVATKTFAVAALAFCAMSTASKAVVVFDNISNTENAVAGANFTATSSTPNTFMGDGYTLLAGTTSITGFDLLPYNNSGTSFTGLRLTIYVWGTVNTGAVAAATPAFSNLLNTYTVTSTGSFPTGNFFGFENAVPGSAPGISIAPLTLTGTTVGITVNVQGTTDGVTYASFNSLTSIISYGTAPSVGSLTLGGTTGGYYRNANSETNGNFTSTLRTLSGLTYQGVAIRVYGNAVPEPGTWAMIALGAAGLVVVQTRRRAVRA